jgi:hypothetical protein
VRAELRHLRGRVTVAEDDEREARRRIASHLNRDDGGGRPFLRGERRNGAERGGDDDGSDTPGTTHLLTLQRRVVNLNQPGRDAFLDQELTLECQHLLTERGQVRRGGFGGVVAAAEERRSRRQQFD